MAGLGDWWDEQLVCELSETEWAALTAKVGTILGYAVFSENGSEV
jgi:hypothetical protein